jgi:hypothetical protein
MNKSGAKKCFIILPISTPKNYSDFIRDSDHFKHVLDCLVFPAVIKAGFEPIEPTAGGSEIIHSRIIRNLETSEMVLCDMSSLNPNVFYEFGIRTALNKPICMIKDTATEKIPFDATIMNCFTYSENLRPWLIEDLIKKLAEHIQKSETDCNGENPFWKLLGFKIASQGQPSETTGAETKALTLENQILKSQLEANLKSIPKTAKIRDGYIIDCKICGYGYEVEGYQPYTVRTISSLYGEKQYTSCPKCGNKKSIEDHKFF